MTCSPVPYLYRLLPRLSASLPPEVKQVAVKADLLLGKMADNVKTNLGAARVKVMIILYLLLPGTNR